MIDIETDTHILSEEKGLSWILQLKYTLLVMHCVRNDFLGKESLLFCF